MQVIKYIYIYKLERRFILITESHAARIENVAPKYKGKKTSGFSRIVPVKYRDGDNAKMVLLELV
ncbi:bL17 family ribosomal protein [Candidatus Gracilibacteria bacterium]|nr:bL17 family ribosomal protein [Candidatus Gracilibacteria bacterium]